MSESTPSKETRDSSTSSANPFFEAAVKTFLFSNSHLEGEQSFSSSASLPPAPTARERTAEFKRQETIKDNNLRREREKILFYVVVGVLLVALVLGFTVALLANNDETRAFGQGLVTLILGGIVGGVAGYLTGSHSN